MPSLSYFFHRPNLTHIYRGDSALACFSGYRRVFRFIGKIHAEASELERQRPQYFRQKWNFAKGLFSSFFHFNTRILENIFSTKQGNHVFAVMTRVLLIVITRPHVSIILLIDQFFYDNNPFILEWLNLGIFNCRFEISLCFFLLI